jgi:mono/diheme cytochrome c family protein
MLMKAASAAFLMLSLVGISALTVAQSQERPDESKAHMGERTFKVYCTSCHGPAAKGDGPLAKDLKTKPANLTELSKRNDGAYPLQMVLDTIDHGRNVAGHGSQDMPAWGDAFEMTEQTEAAAKAKIEQVAHYLWSIQVQ